MDMAYCGGVFACKEREEKRDPRKIAAFDLTQKESSLPPGRDETLIWLKPGSRNFAQLKAGPELHMCSRS